MVGMMLDDVETLRRIVSLETWMLLMIGLTWLFWDHI
jgi:hypothetical protein